MKQLQIVEPGEVVWRDVPVPRPGKGQLTLSPLVTHSLPFTRYQEGIEWLHTKRAIKVCFLPWEGE
jgi:hypothetical protein